MLVPDVPRRLLGVLHELSLVLDAFLVLAATVLFSLFHQAKLARQNGCISVCKGKVHGGGRGENNQSRPKDTFFSLVVL